MKTLSVLLLSLFLPLTNYPLSQAEVNPSGSKNITPDFVKQVYESLNAEDARPSFHVFFEGYTGYQTLLQQKQIKEKKFLTLIDFSLSSTKKRLWVIDLAKNTVVFHELVAHGINSGEEYAEEFSNEPGSHQSSLGFYKTAELYHGKHGLSLRLDGLEPGINNNARKRAIVIHGAGYVNPDFIENQGRLGRSFGCPAVSKEVNSNLIRTIKDGTCLFIYYPDENYYLSTSLLPHKIDLLSSNH